MEAPTDVLPVCECGKTLTDFCSREHCALEGAPANDAGAGGGPLQQFAEYVAMIPNYLGGGGRKVSADVLAEKARDALRASVSGEAAT